MEGNQGTLIKTTNAIPLLRMCRTDDRGIGLSTAAPATTQQKTTDSLNQQRNGTSIKQNTIQLFKPMESLCPEMEKSPRI